VDTALLVMTIVSLGAALVSALAVWRMKQTEQQRSDARAAALAVAADGDTPLLGRVVDRPSVASDRPSLVGDRQPAIVNRPAFSSARPSFTPSVAYSMIDDRSAPLDDRPSTMNHGPSTIDEPSFFGTVQREAPASGRFAFVAVAALIVALGGAVVVFTTSGHDRAPGAAAARTEPLELISLGHSRADSSLTISGVVRNPAKGPRLEGLTAVVSLIDTHGGLIATKDVPLDYRALGPGEEAPFKVTVPDPGSVARYRVSFRAGTDVVPHVDRRGDTKLASAL
jgi:hypothetical protein